MGKEEFLRFAADHGFPMKDINMIVADVESEATDDNPPNWEYAKNCLLFYDPRLAHYKMSKEEFLIAAKKLGYTDQHIQDVVESVEQDQRDGFPPAWEAWLIELPVAAQ